nr:hypothetical protein [Tanacetum cinerariifolium]
VLTPVPTAMLRCIFKGFGNHLIWGKGLTSYLLSANKRNVFSLEIPDSYDYATSVHDDVGVPDAAADDNAKATSVCDDINEADATADDNTKATSVHDDVGVPIAAADDNAKAMSVCVDIDEADAVVDDNAKATSVCDDINEVDAAANDNAMATSVHGNVGVPDVAADDNAKIFDNENVLIKDAHKIINHTDPPIYGFQIMLWGGLEKKRDGLDEAKANQKDSEPEEVVLAADNGEVVKETQLPDSHEDVFQRRASKRMKKETLLSDCPPVIGNYLKEIHIARWEERFQWVKDKNTRPQRSFGFFKSSKEATSLVSLGEWLESR